MIRKILIKNSEYSAVRKNIIFIGQNKKKIRIKNNLNKSISMNEKLIF
jgi:hypothetical protein